MLFFRIFPPNSSITIAAIRISSVIPGMLNIFITSFPFFPAQGILFVPKPAEFLSQAVKFALNKTAVFLQIAFRHKQRQRVRKGKNFCAVVYKQEFVVLVCEVKNQTFFIYCFHIPKLIRLSPAHVGPGVCDISGVLNNYGNQHAVFLHTSILFRPSLWQGYGLCQLPHL